TTYNEVEILQNAQEKYPRLLEDIRNATHSIHMDYYIWEADKFTEEVRDLLIEKVKEGVQVRILYDAVGNLKALDRRYVRSMRDGGIEIYSYLNWLSPYKIHTVGYRNHRKIAIIDGRIGFLGGLNMSQDHLDGGIYFDSWRDTHLRIVGEAVSVLQSIFITSWYNTTYEKLADDAFFAAAQNPPDHYLPVQITTSGPDSQWAAIRQVYLFMILAAEDHVYIQSPFFIPDSPIAEALKTAALAGVDVRIMSTPRGTTYSVPYWAANTYFAEMAEAGIKIYLYQKGYFHSKTISIDGELCSIGTANMDIRSFRINYEANAVIYDRNIAAELETDFLQDMKDCLEFSLEEYEERNVFLRFRDSLARLASPLL
ncbi:MAG: cardiolipin synthase, partial [Anaerolineales bacterium]|nr:cardiolipin synthase [Anaerolineales bacterium]